MKYVQTLCKEGNGISLATGILLLVSAILAWGVGDSGVYVALTAIVCGILGVLCSVWQVGGIAGAKWLLIWGGSLYLCLLGVLCIKRKKMERRRFRAEEGRRLQYTLPERENEFIRIRLNTVLKEPKKELNAYLGGGNLENPIQLRHAFELLNKVKSASLTTAERLQLDEMDKVFSMYVRKENWTSEDLRAVNELFALLLKLSAKYAV